MFLADRILESYTRALKVFWKVFGIGGGIATVVALGLAIFGGYNELFAYVGGVWLLGLSICAVLSLTLFYGIAVVGIGCFAHHIHLLLCCLLHQPPPHTHPTTLCLCLKSITLSNVLVVVVHCVPHCCCFMPTNHHHVGVVVFVHVQHTTPHTMSVVDWHGLWAGGCCQGGTKQ